MLRLVSGKLTRYSNTCPLTRAAATRALTLNVFLAFAFPVETLKLPSMPMIASSTRSTTGGRVNSSVTRMSERFHTSSISSGGSRIGRSFHLRPPDLRPASSRARSASMMIFRSTCVIARLIFPLCLMRLAVGRLHPKSRASPESP